MSGCDDTVQVIVCESLAIDLVAFDPEQAPLVLHHITAHRSQFRLCQLNANVLWLMRCKGSGLGLSEGDVSANIARDSMGRML